MVIDKIENQNIYRGLSNRMAQAFDYICSNDLSQLLCGRYEIDGDNIFAIIMEYDTKSKVESNFEGHHKYIDLQYIISGTELIGFSSLTNQIPFEKNNDHDYDLYNIDSDLFRFSAGTFMIFFPKDLHMPGVSIDQVSKIKKVVVKIKV